MYLVDSHCHLDWDSFDGEREAVMQRASTSGVGLVLNPGTDLARSRRAQELAERFEAVYAAVGIHPNDAGEWGAAAADELHDLAAHPKVLAIGEIGLDYHWDKTTPELQAEVFHAQLDLAAELELPVIIHNREAGEDVMAILVEWQQKLADDDSPLAERPGVLHSFSSDKAMAQTAIRHNFYIGITGPVTFKNAPDLQALVTELPLDHLLIETDSPFLTPHPHRGQRNEPAYVALVADKVAELKGIAVEAVASATTANVRDLFRVGVPV
jgi:TatD DNase family protein